MKKSVLFAGAAALMMCFASCNGGKKAETAETTPVEEPAKQEVVETPALPVEETPKETPVRKEVDPAPVIPVAAKGNVSLNDLLEKKNLSDFRKAFSLNDRFRFRRDLFHGNEEQMNQVIADLNQIDSLDEALRFIDTNLSWDMNNETVADFIKLLEKRYI